VSLGLLVFLSVTLLDSLDQLGELRLVLRSDLGQSNDGGSLLVHKSTESGLALDDGVWDTHLSAESWEEDDQLNWVNIVWNENQRSLLVLDETDNVVETVLDGIWLLADILLLLSVLDSGSLLGETFLLLSLVLWAVLVEELESLGGGVSVEDILELSDRRWDLQSEVEDLLLALETDILWPLYHAGEITTRLDVLTDTIVAGALLDERVLSNISI